MRIFRCDHCGRDGEARYIEAGRAEVPEEWIILSRWGTLADDERTFEFCSTTCTVEWLRVRDQ